MNLIQLPVIGVMHSPFREKFGIPRQPNLVQVECYVEMNAPFNDVLAFEGIEEFSHLWLIWQFHDNKNQQTSEKFRPQVRPPRLGGNKKIGVFATRSMYRPAPIGLSVVQFLRIEKLRKSVRLYVSGSDLLNGTPILDIKPYIYYSDAIEHAQSGYAQVEPAQKQVVWSAVALEQQQLYLIKQHLSQQKLNEIEQVLSFDPRPAYQQDHERIYKMRFDQFDISFNVDEHQVYILELNLCAD